MSDLGRQSGSNGVDLEVNSRHKISLDEITIYIRRMKESNPPLFSARIDSIDVEDWIIVISQNFRALFIPKRLRVAIPCMFLKGEPAAWFEVATEPHLYRWNKFRSSLERNFGSTGAPWEKRMVKEFGNCTDYSSDGDFGRDEDAGPSNVPDREARDDDTYDYDYDSGDSDGDYEEDSEEGPEEESDGDKTRENVVVHKG